MSFLIKLYYKRINIRLRVNSINYFLKIIFIKIIPFIAIKIYIIINYIKIILRSYKNQARYIYREIKFRNSLINFKKILKLRKLIKN